MKINTQKLRQKHPFFKFSFGILTILVITFICGGVYWLSIKNLETQPLQTAERNKVVVKDETATPTTITQNQLQAATMPLAFRWQAGARQTYRYRLFLEIEVNNQIITDTPDIWQKTSIELQGTLNVRIFKLQADQVYVGFQLSPLQLLVGGQRAPHLVENLYQTFFMVTFTLEGQSKQFYFPHYLKPKEQTPIAEIIKSVQVVLPSPSNISKIKQWTTQETHGTGEYKAQYSWKKGKIQKQKLAYLKVISVMEGISDDKSGFTLSGRIIRSRFLSKIATQKSWLQAFTGDETLEIGSEYGKFSKTSSQVSLQISNAPIDPQLPIWQAADDPTQVILAFADMQSLYSANVWETVRQQQLREKFAHTTAAQIMQQITVLSEQDKSMTDIVPFLLDFQDYLSVYPEAAIQIPALLRQGPISSRTSALIIGALETVGTIEAQQALAELMQATEPTQKMQVTQSVMSAGGITEPAPILIDTLWQLAHQSDDEWSTALLALGSASHHLEQADDNLAASQIRQQLIDYLVAKETHEGQQYILLKALANTHHNDLFDTIVPYLKAENNNVRAAAHSVLKNFADPTSLDYLVTTVTTDSSVTVRKIALEALNYREDKYEAVEPIRQTLAKEPDSGLRVQIIRFLGEHKASAPDLITATLQQQLTRETSRDMKKEIYKALYYQPSK